MVYLRDLLTRASKKLLAPKTFEKNGFRVNRHTCYSAFQKGKEKRKKKKREVEETAANCVKF